MHLVRTFGFPARVRFLIGCSEEDEEGEPAALQGIVTNYYDLFIPQTPKDIQKMLIFPNTRSTWKGEEFHWL